MTLTKIGKHYHARIRTVEGKQTTITTRATDKDEARRIVKESGIADLERAAKSGRLTQEAIGRVTSGRKLTTGKAVADYITNMATYREPKTVANIANTLACWLRDMKLESLPPSALNEKHIDPWINDTESTIKAQTRKLNLSAIRGFFDWCLSHGYVFNGNPAGKRRCHVAIRLLTHEQREAKELIPFNHHEVKRLVLYFEAQGEVFWQFATLCAWEIGLRLGDICQLEFDCFDKPGHVTVWTDKRDRRISVPISDALAELVTLIPLSHDRYLFPEQRTMNSDPKRRAFLSVYFKRYCERNEITGKSFHCLRHACVTRLNNQFKTEGMTHDECMERIGKIVGHGNKSTTEKYVH